MQATWEYVNWTIMEFAQNLREKSYETLGTYVLTLVLFPLLSRQAESPLQITPKLSITATRLRDTSIQSFHS